MPNPSENRWIAYRKANPRSRLRLFCFPYAGGGAAAYRGWSARIHPEVDLCPVQLPGRDARLAETPYTSVHALVRDAADGLQPLLDVPFALFGYSMGALIAFELARELRRRGAAQPVHLFLAARRGARRPDPRPPLHHLPDAELVEELGRLEGTPREILDSPEILQLFLPVLRADFTLCETYRYQDDAPLECSLGLYGGLADPDVSREDLDAWRDETTGRARLRMFNGNHFFLHGCGDLVLRLLNEDLAALLDPV